MKKNKINIELTENPFGMSIGDLMSALLLIFVLLLASTLIRLHEEYNSKTEIINKLKEELKEKATIAERYDAIKTNLYNKLKDEFKNDLIKWNAELEKETLTFRFKEPDVLFDTGKYDIKKNFKDILDDFFPRYINILSLPDFKNNIEEIRIEGHTDSDGPFKGLYPDFDYFFNMKLSQDRTRSVLEYVLKETIKDNEIKKWVQKRLTANGLSYSKLIYSENGEEDKKSSRRVEFRVRTNAEEQIKEILKHGIEK